jgi:O-antigen ligase
MEWLIEEGVVGFGLYIAFLIAVARLCVNSYPLARANPVFAGLIVALIMRLWPLASSTGVFSRWGAPPFWLVLGTLLVYTVREPTGKRHDADSSLAVKNTGI